MKRGPVCSPALVLCDLGAPRPLFGPEGVSGVSAEAQPLVGLPMGQPRGADLRAVLTLLGAEVSPLYTGQTCVAQDPGAPSPAPGPRDFSNSLSTYCAPGIALRFPCIHFIQRPFAEGAVATKRLSVA